jgi:polyisoprenyl-phosphate glycosyltransferase
MKIFSIVIPVFQNESNIRDAAAKLLALRERMPGYELELLFVEDGSKDRSFEVLKELSEKHPNSIRVVKLSRNFGQTPAIQAGLRFARGECVGVISADLQEPHEVFVDMLREWERGAKFIIGERAEREESKAHQSVSGIYWGLIRRLAFPEFPRLGYDFCLLDRQVVEDINRINEKNSSIFVLIYWLGYRPVRIPVVRKLREVGTSQWRLWTKVRFTLDTLIGFTYLPARVITVMGFVIGTLCIVYLAFLLVGWFLYRSAPPGWMTVAGLLTLLGAMLLFSLGIVSEYLLRILDEARKRPPYVVEQVIGGPGTGIPRQ